MHVLVTSGFANPDTELFPVPSSLIGLEGLTLHFQAGFPPAWRAASIQVTNPASVVLRS